MPSAYHEAPERAEDTSAPGSELSALTAGDRADDGFRVDARTAASLHGRRDEKGGAGHLKVADAVMSGRLSATTAIELQSHVARRVQLTSSDSFDSRVCQSACHLMSFAGGMGLAIK
jgi:hypothetical protein